MTRRAVSSGMGVRDGSTAAHRAVIAALAALAAGAVLGSCDRLGPTVRVLLELPEPPKHWRAAFPSLSVALEYPATEEGQELTRLPVWETGAVVLCSKATNGPLLAWPVIEGAGEGPLRPAGALWPWDCVKPADCSGAAAVVQLSWREGPIALVVSRLRRAGVDASSVNATRLRERIGAAADPWTWDLDAIAVGLADGTFTAWDLDPLPRADVTVVPGPGDWFLESPFAGPAAAAADGSLDLPGLSFGMHDLFSIAGGRLRVWLGRTGVVTMP